MKRKIPLMLTASILLLLGGSKSVSAKEYTSLKEVNPVETNSYMPLSLTKYSWVNGTPNTFILNSGVPYASENYYLGMSLIDANPILNNLDLSKEFSVTMYTYNELVSNSVFLLGLIPDENMTCLNENTGEDTFFSSKEDEELMNNAISGNYEESLKNKVRFSTMKCKIIDTSLSTMKLNHEEYSSYKKPSSSLEGLLIDEKYNTLSQSFFTGNAISAVNNENMKNSRQLKDNAFHGFIIEQENDIKYSQLTDVAYLYDDYNDNTRDELNKDKDEWLKDKEDEINDIIENQYPPISKEAKNTQQILANILNGGITGGIVSSDVDNGLTTEDIDFGKLVIGQMIEPIQKPTMISVRDWTGGNGWKLTAKHKDADRNQSLQLGVQVIEGVQVDLNNQEQLVTSGQSQLETTIHGGEYSAKWGTHPTVGEFNNVIEWNLTANVSE